MGAPDCLVLLVLVCTKWKYYGPKIIHGRPVWNAYVEKGEIIFVLRGI